MPGTPDNEGGVKRRDAEGRLHVGSSWESLVDRQIREAMKEGKFDDLPHQGRPLPNDDNPYAADWALAYHVLRNAGAAPPWIEADKEVRELLDRRDALVARVAARPATTPFLRSHELTALEQLVASINAAVARVNAEAPTARQHRRPLILADEIARYDEAARR